jgi:hypothetical protein
LHVPVLRFLFTAIARAIFKTAKIEDFAQHFSPFGEKYTRQNNFEVNKTIKVAHIFFVRTDSNSRGREKWQKQ